MLALPQPLVKPRDKLFCWCPHGCWHWTQVLPMVCRFCRRVCGESPLYKFNLPFKEGGYWMQHKEAQDANS